MILLLKMTPQWGLDLDSMGGGGLAVLQHLILVFQHGHCSVWRHGMEALSITTTLLWLIPLKGSKWGMRDNSTKVSPSTLPWTNFTSTTPSKDRAAIADTHFPFASSLVL